jgi:molecular chaperone Hsp33
MPETQVPHAYDSVVPFQVDALGVRGRLVRLGKAAKPLLDDNRYPATVRGLALDTMALTALLASTLKYEGVFSLQVQGDGPVGLLFGDATSEGALRTYAKFDADGVASADSNTSGALPHLVGAGHMAFTVDQGPDTDRYQGISELSGATLAECAAGYFRQSEQLDTQIISAHTETGNGISAAALFLQRLPAAEADTDEAIDAWREAALLAGTVTEAELLNAELPSADLLFNLYHERGVRVFESQPLHFSCRCSHERVVRTLASFPRAEIEDLRVDGVVAVTCEFCGADYRFDDDALARVYSETANR